MEQWRSVVGFENYEVSDLGRVRRKGTQRIKKSAINERGYERVQLRNGRVKWLKVHRLVYMAFCGEIPSGMEIDHIDLNKLNNCVGNLEIVTRAENMRRAKLAGVGGGKGTSRNAGENHYNARLTLEQVMEIHKLFDAKKKPEEIASIYGISIWHVKKIRTGEKWAIAKTK